MSVNPLGPLSALLNALNLPFVVSGSAASSARGIPRSTNDIDLLVRIGEFHAQRLAAALGKDWYCEPEQIRDAIKYGRSFNVIHIPTAWKIDLFLAQTEFHESELERASEQQWRDVGGVIAMNPDVDRQYLDLWARRLGVADLLEKALTLPPEQ